MTDPIVCISTTQSTAGVVGENKALGDGVFGIGHGASGRGVVGTSEQQNGVTGMSTSGTGTYGGSTSGIGIADFSKSWQGVYGHSETNAGVVGEATKFHAVLAVSHDVNSSGVFAHNDAGGFGLSGISETGTGLYAKGGKLAAQFDGPVQHNGDLKIQGNAKVSGDVVLTGADCAEDFAIGTETCVDPGTVMVLRGDGTLVPSQRAYDKCVAGVISGAGEYWPAIILDKQQTSGLRQPVALVGKVYRKVDAQYLPIEVGDLLTTSPTTGHAMKAADATRSHGSVIGKALKPLASGQGLLPVLISLQ